MNGNPASGEMRSALWTFAIKITPQKKEKSCLEACIDFLIR